MRIADFPGAHGSAQIPIARAALNRLIADALAARNLPIKSVDVRPLAGDRFEALIAVTWPFVPTLAASFIIVQQPSLPASPILVEQWSVLGPLGALAGKLIASLDALPKGVTLDGDRLRLDVLQLGGATPAAAFLGYLKTFELHTADDSAVISVELAIPACPPAPGRPDTPDDR